LIVATTAFVLASMTETSLERPFAVYTSLNQDLLRYPTDVSPMEPFSAVTNALVPSELKTALCGWAPRYSLRT